MAEGSLPPQEIRKIGLAAAGGGFLGAAVAVLAVNAITDSDSNTASLHNIDNSQPIAVAELHPASE